MQGEVITFYKGGDDEHTLTADEVKIPNMWHVAQRLQKAFNGADAELVLEIWRVAHALRNHILDRKE